MDAHAYTTPEKKTLEPPSTTSIPVPPSPLRGYIVEWSRLSRFDHYNYYAKRLIWNLYTRALSAENSSNINNKVLSGTESAQNRTSTTLKVTIHNINIEEKVKCSSCTKINSITITTSLSFLHSIPKNSTSNIRVAFAGIVSMSQGQLPEHHIYRKLLRCLQL